MKRIAVLVLAVLVVLAGCKPLYSTTVTTAAPPDNQSTTTTSAGTGSSSTTSTTKGTTTTTEPQKLTGKVVNVSSMVNIRSAPSSSAAALGQAANGTVFTVLTENVADGWHEIDYNGSSGYISADYFEIIRE